MNKYRALVIEDSNIVQFAYKVMLGNLGFQYTIASDARSALAHLGKSAFSVIFCDLCLPDMEGVHLVRLIREKLKGQTFLKIIGVSSGSMIDELKERGLTSDFDALIEKPLTKETLEALLKDKFFER